MIRIERACAGRYYLVWSDIGAWAGTIIREEDRTWTLAIEGVTERGLQTKRQALEIARDVAQGWIDSGEMEVGK